MIKLKDWQENAYTIWKSRKCRGIVEGATGSGKTFIGLKLIEDNPQKRILIVVPTTALLDQWYTFIKKECRIDAGKVGAGSAHIKRVTIAIINSVRDLKLNFDILILDEVHRYMSEVNVNILKNNFFEMVLGLSATAQRQDDKNLKDFDITVITKYTQEDAIKDDVLCQFDVINVGVELLPVEKVMYDSNDRTIKVLMPKFNNDLSKIFGGKWSPEKTKLRRAITKRRTIISNAQNKILKTLSLIRENYTKKIIVFSEYIKTAEAIKKLLDEEFIECGIYHSGVKDKKTVIDNFRNDKFNILLSVKALDEGLNVPTCSIAIIVAGTKTARQIIQRIGRVLRKKEEVARVYQLYVKNTKDVSWLKDRMFFVKGCRKVFFM